LRSRWGETFAALAALANDRLGETMANARKAGLVDWDHIEDRTRDLQVYATYSSPAEVLQEAAQRYGIRPRNFVDPTG
jgi:hypothetical protein